MASCSGCDCYLSYVIQFVMQCESLYLWEDPVLSGVVSASVLAVLVSFNYYSFISVTAYTALALLMVVAGTKLYVYVAKNFMKKEATVDPVANLAAMELVIPADKVTHMASKFTDEANRTIKVMRSLFLIENMIASIKFGISLWLLTFIGSWFNAMTLIIMAWVGIFTVPKIYVNNQAKIDPILKQAKVKVDEVFGKVNALIPKGGPVAEAKKEE